MKWVGGLNHKIHCDSNSYSQEIHSRVPESIYKAGATSLWPIATVAGAEVHYIWIKKTSYEYEVGGGSQS